MHPASLLAFFGCMGTLRGDSPAEVGETIRRDFWPTLCFEVALWTPLDACLFAVVPVRFQVGGCQTNQLRWLRTS